MTNKQFFQEALLEAKTIRETALASAKASLEEAFTPRIKSMIDAKLSLMEDDASDDNEIDETKEMDEAKAKADEAKKVEEKKDMDEAKDMEEGTQGSKANLKVGAKVHPHGQSEKVLTVISLEGGFGGKVKVEDEKGNGYSFEAEDLELVQNEGYGMDENAELDEMELDEILAELEREDANEGVAPAGVPVNPLNLEAKKVDEKKDVDEAKKDVKEGEAAYEYEKGKKAGEKLGEGEGDEDAEEVTELTVDELKDLIRDVLADVLGSEGAAEDDLEADVDVDADGADIEVSDDEEVSDDMELETILRELDKKVEGKMDEKKDVEEAKKKVDEKKVEEKKDVDEAKKEVEEAKKEVDEAVKVIKALKNELNEVNLLNAKLLYVNKIFKSKSLTESQKVKVINAFDRAESVKEVKNTYETLKESFNGTSQKSAIKESVGFASKTVLGGSTTSAPIVETDSFVARMQKLAGIK